MNEFDLDGSRQSLENAFNRLVTSIMQEVKPKFIDMYLEKYNIAHDRYMNTWAKLLP